jgi:hypothetical protein
MDKNLAAGAAYGWVVVGILLSLLIPIIVKAIKSAGGDLGTRSAGSALWSFAKPYLLMGLLAAAVAIIIVAQIDFKDWRAAVLGGYAWDATLQKIKAGLS